MIDWIVKLEDVACPVDDMMNGLDGLFKFLLGKGER
jgi:hypothetical protein